MERNIDINDISDGKRYAISDMVKVGCSDCEGCSKCCEHMDGLIVLDPYDVHRLVVGLLSNQVKDVIAFDGIKDDLSFNGLIDKKIEFTVDRGLLLPVLKMDDSLGKCVFLSENGRCSIHDIRPGICRLFPMGRLYEDGSFSYFLQKDECDYPGKTKVKLKNWINTPEISKYEKYINDWHYFIRDIQDYMKTAEEPEIKQINSALMQMFFMAPYSESFYDDFYIRLNKVKMIL